MFQQEVHQVSLVVGHELCIAFFGGPITGSLSSFSRRWWSLAAIVRPSSTHSSRCHRPSYGRQHTRGRWPGSSQVASTRSGCASRAMPRKQSRLREADLVTMDVHLSPWPCPTRLQEGKTPSSGRRRRPCCPKHNRHAAEASSRMELWISKW
jgi:hypothetical protein